MGSTRDKNRIIKGSIAIAIAVGVFVSANSTVSKAPEEIDTCSKVGKFGNTYLYECRVDENKVCYISRSIDLMQMHCLKDLD